MPLVCQGDKLESIHIIYYYHQFSELLYKNDNYAALHACCSFFVDDDVAVSPPPLFIRISAMLFNSFFCFGALGRSSEQEQDDDALNASFCFTILISRWPFPVFVCAIAAMNVPNYLLVSRCQP